MKPHLERNAEKLAEMQNRKRLQKYAVLLDERMTAMSGTEMERRNQNAGGNRKQSS